jgi:hypothetical protein
MRIGIAYAMAEPDRTLVRAAVFFDCTIAIWALLPRKGPR